MNRITSAFAGGAKTVYYKGDAYRIPGLLCLRSSALTQQTASDRT